MPIEVRAAVAADIFAFYGRTAPQSLRAKVLVRDGEVIGLAGHYLMNGVAVVFSESKGDVPKMTVWRESVKFMKTLSLPAICVASDGSGPFLERLGWRHVDGEIYRYEP